MKIQVFCNQCMHNFVDGGGQDLSQLSLSQVSVRDDGVYELTCPRGHKSVSTLSAERFDILFEVGANAILDGYYREAVSSFTSSLERFYEYFLCLVTIHRKLSDGAWEDCWRNVKSQSERQLGAFIYVWLLETGNAPSQLSNKWREFRNRVIHKGYIPSEDEAVEYGEAVLRLLHEGIELVRREYQEARGVLMGRQAMAFPRDKYKDHVAGGMGMATIVSLSNADAPQSLERGLAHLRKSREMFALQQALSAQHQSKR